MSVSVGCQIVYDMCVPKVMVKAACMLPQKGDLRLAIYFDIVKEAEKSKMETPRRFPF